MNFLCETFASQRLSSQAVFLMFHETPGSHENPNKTAQLSGFIVS